jgi:DNA repair protein RecO (recombination protein O)
VKTVVDDAVVAMRRDFSEADRVIELLTCRHGKVSAFAVKAKSSRKRFGGGLELGSWLKVWLRPRASALWRLEKVELVDNFPRLRQSLEATAKAMYALELCREVFQEGESMEGVFPSLVRLMKSLQQAPTAVAPLMRFELAMLSYAGWAPQLHSCECCNADVLGQSVVVSSPEGVVCTACSKHADALLALSKETLVVLFILQRQAGVALSTQRRARQCLQKPRVSELSSKNMPPPLLSALSKQFPDEKQISEMRSFLDRLWFFHLGKDLKVRAFMDEMAR